MKRLYWLSISLLLLGLSACQTAPQAPGYTSKEGRFSIQMPEAPIEKVNKLGMGGELHLFILVRQGVRYAVSYLDLPPQLIKSVDPEMLFDRTRDGVAKGFHGKLLNESRFRFSNKYPGREIKLLNDEGIRAVRGRIYLINNRLYQVAIGLPKDELDSRTALDFLDSFKAWE